MRLEKDRIVQVTLRSSSDVNRICLLKEIRVTSWPRGAELWRAVLMNRDEGPIAVLLTESIELELSEGTCQHTDGPGRVQLLFGKESPLTSGCRWIHVSELVGASRP